MAGDVTVAVVSAQLSTSGTGTTDFTKSGFGTPKACIVIMTEDEADGTTVSAQSRASIGFSDFTNHRCITHQDEDASAKVDCDALKSNTKAYVILNVTPTVIIDGTAGTITDGIRLTNTSNQTTEAPFVTVIMFGGADQAIDLRRTGIASSQNGTANITHAGLTDGNDKLIFFIGSDISGEDSANSGINNSFGVCHISGNDAGGYTFVQRCIGWSSDHNNAIGTPGLILSTDRVLDIITETRTQDWGLEVTAFSSSGGTITVTTRDNSAGANMEVYSLIVDLDDRKGKVFSVDGPISGTTWVVTGFGFKPQYVGLGLTWANLEDAIHTTRFAGVSGISSNTGSGEETCHSWYNEDDAVTTNTNNLFRSRVIDLRDDDVITIVQDHSHLSFDNDGFTTTINAESETTAKKWFGWAIEEAAVGGITLSPVDLNQIVDLESPGLTQNHVLASVDADMLFVFDALAITQGHVLPATALDLLVFLDAPTIEEQQVLVTVDLDMLVVIDAFSVTQNHVLAVTELDMLVVLDGATITQGHVLSATELTMLVVFDAVFVVPELAAQDLTMIVDLEAPGFSQNHVIASVDLDMLMILDGITITQNHVLVVADLDMLVVIDAFAMTQNHVLPSVDLDMLIFLEDPILDVQQLLVTADLDMLVILDGSTITQGHVLAVSDLDMLVVLDGVVITQNHVLVAVDLDVLVVLDGVTVTQGHVLASVDADMLMVLDAPTIEEQQVLVTVDLDMIVVLDGATMSQGHVLAAVDLDMLMVLDGATITQGHVLVAIDADMLMALDGVTMTQGHVLASVDLDMLVILDGATISQGHVLSATELTMLVVLDGATITITNFVLSTEEMTMLVVLDSATITVSHVLATTDLDMLVILDGSTLEFLVAALAPVTRQVIVRSDVRQIIVPFDPRDVIVAGTD